MSISSKDKKIPILLEKIEEIIMKISKEKKLGIEDIEELRASSYLILSEACKNDFICKKFFDSNDDSTYIFEEYIEPKIREWLNNYLITKLGVFYCGIRGLNSNCVTNPEEVFIQNNVPFDFEDIRNILLKLSEEERLYMLRFLYYLEKGDVVLFGNEDLNQQIKTILRGCFTRLKTNTTNNKKQNICQNK